MPCREMGALVDDLVREDDDGTHEDSGESQRNHDELMSLQASGFCRWLLRTCRLQRENAYRESAQQFDAH